MPTLGITHYRKLNSSVGHRLPPFAVLRRVGISSTLLSSMATMFGGDAASGCVGAMLEALWC